MPINVSRLQKTKRSFIQEFNFIEKISIILSQFALLSHDVSKFYIKVIMVRPGNTQIQYKQNIHWCKIIYSVSFALKVIIFLILCAFLKLYNKISTENWFTV